MILNVARSHNRIFLIIENDTISCKVMICNIEKNGKYINLHADNIDSLCSFGDYLELDLHDFWTFKLKIKLNESQKQYLNSEIKKINDMISNYKVNKVYFDCTTVVTKI